jgi:hypothetical protein
MYQDSFPVLSRQNGWSPKAAREWYARRPHTDSGAMESLTASLIDGIDSLLGVLDAQAGAYKLTGSSITFEDRSASREYSALRQQITATVDSAIGAGGNSSKGPLGYLLQAIGTTRLPRES